MNKINFTALATFLGLSILPLSHGRASDLTHEYSEEGAPADPVRKPQLCIIDTDDAFTIAKIQNDFSKTLGEGIRDYIEENYRLLMQQMKNLKDLGVDLEGFRPVLLKAYVSEGFFERDLGNSPVQLFSNMPLKANIVSSLLQKELQGDDISYTYRIDCLGSNAFSRQKYKAIYAYLKDKFEEFIIMVAGSSLTEI